MYMINNDRATHFFILIPVVCTTYKITVNLITFKSKKGLLFNQNGLFYFL
jgi:hypothetical protein